MAEQPDTSTEEPTDPRCPWPGCGRVMIWVGEDTGHYKHWHYGTEHDTQFDVVTKIGTRDELRRRYGGGEGNG